MPELAPTIGPLAGVGQGIAQAGQRAAAFGEELLDLTGIRGVVGKVEESVNRIRNFTNEQIDALVNGAVSSARATEAFVLEALGRVQGQTDATIGRAIRAADDLEVDLRSIPERAGALVEDARTIKARASARRDALRQHSRRFRDRRRQFPRLVAHEIELLSEEFEAELELDAIQAEQLGQRIQLDSEAFYDQTVNTAQLHASALVSQAEQARQRAKRLRKEVSVGIGSASQWAIHQVKKVDQFRVDRMRSAGAISSPIAAQQWATSSIEAAHRLAGEIRDDVARKPGEVMNFAQERVSEATQISQDAHRGIEIARSWAITQSGLNAQWKQRMRSNRDVAKIFLADQGSRVIGRAESHGLVVEQSVQALAESQVSDSKEQFSNSIADVREAVTETKRAIDPDVGQVKAKPIEEPRLDFVRPPEVSVEEVVQAQPARSEASSSVVHDPPKQVLLEKPKPTNLPPKGKSVGKRSIASDEPKRSERAVAPHNPTTSRVFETEPVVKPKPASLTPKSVSEPVKEKVSTKSSPSIAVTSKAGSAPQTPQTVEIGVEQKPKKAPVHSKVDAGQRVPDVRKPKSELPKGLLADAPSAKTASKLPVSTSSPKPPSSTDSGQAKPPAPVKPKKLLDAVQPTKGAETPKLSLPQATPKETAAKPSDAKLQRQPNLSQPAMAPQQLESRLIQAGGTGEAPDPGTRAELTRHIGFDPSMMRLHTGPAAQAAASALNADAFTIGPNVFFGAGKFDPRSPKGLGLIGHEATHVGQQLGLRGDKMRFATKTGGDAMEQEAQEVGERIAANLAYSNSFRVGRFIRTYEPADDEPITTGTKTKLDRLSLRALARAGELMSARRKTGPMRLDEVLVDLVLDLEASSDQEIIQQWAEAIVMAAESTSPFSGELQSREMLTPATHLLQRRLGDKAAEPNPLPQPTIDEDVLARLVKITPSSEETGMIRKLLVRDEVDTDILFSRIKQWKEDKDDFWNFSLGSVVGLTVIPVSDAIHDDDRASIEATLRKHGIQTYEDYLRLKKDFVKAFHAKGMNITKFLLMESLNVVKQQQKRYREDDKKDPDSPLNSLRTAAKEVKDAAERYITVLEQVDTAIRVGLGPQRTTPNLGNLDTLTDIYASAKLHADHAGKLDGARDHWMKVRQSHGNKHPILLGRDFDVRTITNSTSTGQLRSGLLDHLDEVEQDINTAYGRFDGDKFWELHPMIALTKKQMGVRPDEGADIAISDYQKERANDEMFWGILKAAAAIALAVTAMVATGGLAAVAMVGSGALSIYSASQAYDDYMFKSAAVNSSLDQANLISKEEPSLFWLALELIGAGLDIGPAIGAFAKLARVAKRATTMAKDAAAIEEMSELARTAYRELPERIAMTEDDFVKRLIDTASKGVNAADDAKKFAGQIKLISELLEGTSARAVGILKGDKAAIQSLVKEHGNWKGLIGGLKNGGHDAELMASNLGKWRQEIVDDLKFKGGDTLPGATDDIASDFDINIKELTNADGTVTKGAGQNLIDLEAEMVAKYGDNWESMLHMNFYTEGSRLLAVDDALRMLPSNQRAAIIKRVTADSEKFNFAKMLDHAGDSKAAREQVLSLMQDAGVKHSLDELDNLIKTLKGTDQVASRNSRLLEIDRLMAEMNSLPPKHPRRVKLAEQITEKQMEANFLMKEAYISPSAIKAGAMNQAEAYHSALAQLEMMSHVLSECGGDVLKACREYELYKYISRYTAAARNAGVRTPALTYFEGLSSYIYKRSRSAHMQTGHLPGVTSADEVLEKAITPEYLMKTYNEFRDEVSKTLPELKKVADTNPAGGWRPRTPDAAPVYGPKIYTGPENLYVPKPLDLKKAAALPSAAIQTAHTADKIMKGKGMPIDKYYPDMEPVVSSGFKAERRDEGFGVFKGRVYGVAGEVWLTVLPSSEDAKFNNQLAAALAAEKAGFGPKVHGKITLGTDKLAFATDIVSGGFADDFNDESKSGAFSRTGKNRQEMLSYARKITPQTFMDVDAYRDKMWESGYFYWDHPQGFVTPEGRWKPINFTGASPITKETMLEIARPIHDVKFDALKERLMQYHIEARKGSP